jgi:hypothetical protein
MSDASQLHPNHNGMFWKKAQKLLAESHATILPNLAAYRRTSQALNFSPQHP